MAAAPKWRLTGGDGGGSLNPEGVTELETPAWTGRFERMSFGAGFHLHMGRVETAADCEITAVREDSGTTISAFAVVAGRAVLHLHQGLAVALTPSRAVLLTPQRHGGIFRLPGGQTMRFFSVALGADLLERLLDGGAPALRPLLEGRGQAAFVQEFKISPLTRSRILKLGNPRRAGTVERLHREGVALQFLAELIEPGLRENAGEPAALSPREERALRTARKQLLADLRDPPTAGMLADAAGMKPRRFLKAFEALHGASPTQLLRLERLEQARLLLDQGRLSVKEVGWQVGYSHTSNFVAAFAGHFGKPPGQFLRRE